MHPLTSLRFRVDRNFTHAKLAGAMPTSECAHSFHDYNRDNVKDNNTHASVAPVICHRYHLLYTKYSVCTVPKCVCVCACVNMNVCVSM